MFLPQLRQGLGRGFPGLRIFDRLHLGVLRVRQQLGLHLGGQGQVLGADRSGIAFGQVDLPRVAQDVLTGQLGGVGVFRVLVDQRGVAGNHRAVRRDQHLEAVRVNLLAIAQAVEVPDDADLHFAFFQGLDGRVGQAQAALFGQLGEQVEAWLDVVLVTAVGDRCGQYAVHGLGRGADVADGHFVGAFFQVSPGVGHVLDQLLVDDKGDGAGVAEHPVAVGILGPVGDLCPGARFERLGHALLHGNRAKGRADVADVGAGVVFLGGELGNFLGRAHVRVHVLEGIEFVQVGPGVFPVGPAIGHADAVDGAFGARRLFQCLDIYVTGHDLSGHGDSSSHQ